jgi:(5-formylfuran-3-yl)methyl phosphate synthase
MGTPFESEQSGRSKMQLMISVVSAQEAQDAILGGAGILDVKNPAEGSLGAQPPQIIREIRKLSPNGINVSAAIGDMPHLPGTAALAALGAAVCGADYIKVGLHGSRTRSEALTLLQEVRQAVREYPVTVVAAGYADFRRAGALDPVCLPHVAASAGAGGVLIDTAVKDGLTLFDFIDAHSLRSLAEQTHAAGLLFGLAGALSELDLPLAQELGADVVGLRTAVCRNNQRGGPIDPDRVRVLLAHNSLKSSRRE